MDSDLISLQQRLLPFASDLQGASLVHAYATAAIFLMVLILALKPTVAPTPTSSRVWSRWWLDGRTFLVAVALLMMWGRLPGLLPGHFNADEALFVAAAQRLLQAPQFWQSVDTGSSGPLNVFPLTLAVLAGLWPDLASSRVIGLSMIIGSVAMFYASTARLYTERVARLATLPLATTVALMQHPDFVHFSSEHGPVLLLSFMLFLVSRVGPGRGASDTIAGRLPSLAIGITAGSMAFAKMQGFPLALLLCAIFIHANWRQRSLSLIALARHAAWIAVGLLLPFVIVGLYLHSHGIADLFWNSYIRSNLLTYADLHSGRRSLFWTVAGIVLPASDLYALLGISVALVILLAGVLGRMATPARRRLLSPARRAHIMYAVAYAGVAAWTVLRPGNPFPHYLLFTLMPVALLLAAALDLLVEREVGESGTNARPVRFAGAAAIVLVVAGTLVPVMVRTKEGSRYLSESAIAGARQKSPLVRAIQAAAPPGSTMAVWGFSANLFMETGNVQGNRYGFIYWQAEKNPLQEDFIREYVRDLQANRPMLFVDAMAQGMFYFGSADLEARRHRLYPAIARVVEQNYQLVATVDGVEVYRRKNLSASDRSI